MESHNISKMIGSPPGYVGYDGGGQLTEAVRRKPYTVLLFDEIEKAHPDIFNVLLQILDEGHLTDAKGRKVDFKNTLIILTSNIGSKVISKGGLSLGFEFDNQDDASYQRIRNRVNEELKAYFRPEFLNRVDDIIVFTQLNKEEIKQIAEIMLRDVASRLVEKGITLEVTDRFQDRVIQEGYDPSYGARPLRRAIIRLLEDNLAEAILSGQIAEGDTAIVDVDDDNQIQVSKSETRELLLTNH
jgi:ATP-dependent Clp protease ATP-binding subunit ClpC